MKHGRYTTDKLETRRRAAEVGRKVKAELKNIELQLRTIGLGPSN